MLAKGVLAGLVFFLLNVSISAEQGTARAVPAKPGLPWVSIVVPDQALPVERHGAEELQGYLARMTGQTLAITAETAAPSDKALLMVGRTKFNLKNHNPDSWPADTIYIGYGSNPLSLIGQGKQGTLFAVYDFLRELGCRWYYSGSEGEYVPRLSVVKLPDRPRRFTPSFAERGWTPSPAMASAAGWPTSLDWAVRNGLNTLLQVPITDYGPERGYGRKIRGNHTIWVLIPSADDPHAKSTFAAHPDWYPLVDGKRVMQYKDGRPVQACVSNPEVVREVARKVIVFLKANPDCVRFSVSHSDEPTYACECDKCRAMDGPGSTWKANGFLDAYPHRSPNGPGPLSRRWVMFVNAVARLVAKECPGQSISFFAYGSTCAPPRTKDWTLEPNVMVEFINGGGGEYCLRHGDEDKSCLFNVDSNQWLAGWLSRKRPVIYYEYPPNGPNWTVPAGYTKRYHDYIAFTRKMGVSGWSGECQGPLESSALFLYLKARWLWNVDDDADTLIGDFCRHQYGPAAPTMVKYYDAFDRAIQQVPGHAVYGGWALTLPETSVRQLAAMLDRAQSEAKTAADKNHVAMMQTAMKNLSELRAKNAPKKTNAQLNP